MMITTPIAVGLALCSGIAVAALVTRGPRESAPPAAPAVRVVPLTYYSPPPTTFDDRFAAIPLQQIASAEPGELAPLPPPRPQTKAQKLSPIDPVCGARGRRYFRIGRHQSWRCRR